MLNDILKVVEQQFSPFTFQLGPPAVVQTLHFREFIVKLALKQSYVLPIKKHTVTFAVEVDDVLLQISKSCNYLIF